MKNLIRTALILLLFLGLVIDPGLNFLRLAGAKSVLSKKKATKNSKKASKAKIDKTYQDPLKIKPKKLLQKSLTADLLLRVFGRRFAQGEVLFFKIQLLKAGKEHKIVNIQLKSGKKIFRFFPVGKVSGATKKVEAFLPISPTEKPGKKEIVIFGKIAGKNGNVIKVSARIKINIKSGKFKKSYFKESLKVKKRYTTRLSKKMRLAVAGQHLRVRKALGSSKRKKRFWYLPFIHPTGGTKITSVFWKQRFYNKKPGSPHGGTDFRGKVGHPVKAINNGIIVFAESTFYAGNLIIIDHGDKFFSLYMHQSQLLVKKGDFVQKGKVIGKVGATGLATGSHLHLAIIMNGIKVDPISLLVL